MTAKTFPFDQIPQLAARDVDYQMYPQKVKDFMAFFPDAAGIREAIKKRSSFPVDRSLLYHVLKAQYELVEVNDKQILHLEKLKEETTFTITTAHQPLLFTGTMYYLMKMFSVIRLADDLTREYPDHHFVPVFINGAEDHDFEEVQSTHLFHKKITWESTQKGPVGRFDIEDLKPVLDEFLEILGDSTKAQKLRNIFMSAYQQSKTYNDFTFYVVHQLTAEYGLLFVNMDQPDFKRAFIPYFEKELFLQKSESLITKTQESLANLGYKPQAFVRRINLFYFSPDGSRNRIECEEGVYRVVDTDLIWSEDECKKVLHNNPENFSPNVVTRPLYQSAILPDVVFVGGGGEIAYWLERYTQFQAFDLFFPVLIRRNSACIVTGLLQKSLTKLGMQLESFFSEENKIIHDYIRNTAGNHDYFKHEQMVLAESWERLTQQVIQYDASLKGYMEAENIRLSKMVDHVEQKVIRVLKQQEEQKIQQIKNIKQKLFPGNGLQERVDNILQYYISEEVDLFEMLYKTMNPLDKEFKALFF